MRVSYNYEMYELPFLCYLRYKSHLLWFPIRRIGRCVKRNLKRLSLWVAPLLLFSLFSGFVLFLLVKYNGLEGHEAFNELIFILLSSVALLYIKDTFDYERSRKKTLQLQLSVSYSVKYNFASSLTRLFQALEITDIDAWRMFDVPEYQCNYRVNWTPPINDSVCAEVKSALTTIELGLKNLQNQLLTTTFVDYKRGPWDGDQIIETLKDINHALLSLPTFNSADLDKLCHDLRRIVDSLRRPWHYANDQKHHEMIVRLLNERGVKY